MRAATCAVTNTGRYGIRAQWNDDIHHALHVLVTSETDGYYSDYAQDRMRHLGRCLAEGYSFQGDESAFRDGARRGDPSRDLPPTCFVSFMQNHDQIGNRALGERINRIADADTLRVAMAILLLAPSPPLLFMGEEFDADTPFLFFCDFAPELAEEVTSGRRSEFAKFAQFSSPQAQAQIPDPNAKETFLRSKLDWNSLEQERHCDWLKFYRDLLKVRSERVVPRINDIAPGRAEFEVIDRLGLYVRWPFKKSGSLQLFANFDHQPLGLSRKPEGELLYATTYTQDMEWKEIPPLTAAWFLSCMKAPRIPLSTYRLQFNRSFTFSQAAELVPYLAELGITHCYASPYLRSRPGSMHGYDIIDHHHLDPEIGTPEDYERFVTALHQHGMGQILDVVPNHMGIMSADNAWWLEVLENGEASTYAEFFDIDWYPLKDELQGKVLVPVLGDQYGTVLDAGELKLRFDAEKGEFSIFYFKHRFPVNPREYPRILGYEIEKLQQQLSAENENLLELQSLISAFNHLPGREEAAPEKRAERLRDKEIHKRRLAALCARSPEVTEFIERSVAKINGVAGDASSLDSLHELIKAQAYRLAYWRVAADDINYRRFFDVNDLAGLRQENETVFLQTHEFVLQLLADGKIDGLRVDHPDGLYDPKQYFERVQTG